MKYLGKYEDPKDLIPREYVDDPAKGNPIYPKLAGKAPIIGKGVNLLDNWYFANPVNQRGQTEYTGSGYTIDRWSSQQVTQTALLVHEGYITLEASYNDGMRQRIDGNIFSQGDVLTASTLTLEGELFSATIVAPEKVAGNIVIKRLSGEWFIVLRYNENDTWDIYQIHSYSQTALSINVKAVKLELGSQQTLAHQEENGSWVLSDPPPNYQQELAKCQRHQEAGISYIGRIGANNTSIDFTVPYKVSKRATPSLTIKSENNADGKLSYFNNNMWTDVNATISDRGGYGARIIASSLPSNALIGFTVFADANL